MTAPLGEEGLLKDGVAALQGALSLSRLKLWVRTMEFKWCVCGLWNLNGWIFRIPVELLGIPRSYEQTNPSLPGNIIKSVARWLYGRKFYLGMTCQGEYGVNGHGVVMRQPGRQSK